MTWRIFGCKLKTLPIVPRETILPVRKNLLAAAYGLLSRCPPPPALDLLSPYFRQSGESVNPAPRSFWSASVSYSVLLTIYATLRLFPGPLPRIALRASLRLRSKTFSWVCR